MPPQLMRVPALFLLTPLREGRQEARVFQRLCKVHFYSRPCGRGDTQTATTAHRRR